MVVVGAIDDRDSLGTKSRFAAQIMASLCLILGTGLTLTDLGDLIGFGPIELGWLAVPFTLFAMVGVINAFNLIDGIDGLAGGLALIGLVTLLLLSPELSGLKTLMLITIAALIPYLVSNLELFGLRGCKVFLGDAGSMLLGYILVWASIDASQPGGPIHPVTALWIIAIPLMDTLAVVLWRLLRGTSPFKADRSHLHHLLSRLLGSTRLALVVILTLATVLAVMGVALDLKDVASSITFFAALGIFGVYLVLLGQPQWLLRVLRCRHHARPLLRVTHGEIKGV